MKVVILAGGFGSRITEESHLKPKPMVEIGGMPILWHIMKYYSHFGFNDFVICCGYRGYVIKEYFANYYLHRSDITFDFSDDNKMIVHSNVAEPWKVTLVDTGLNTMTGGRIKRIHKYTGNQPFLLTYGDGVADIDLKNLLSFHEKTKSVVTLSAVQVGSKFGTLNIKGRSGAASFAEKAIEDGGWINGGYMVVAPEVFKYLKDDNSIFEKDALEKLGKAGRLGAYKHHGFWQCMDTLRDRLKLEELINSDKAPWMVWGDGGPAAQQPGGPAGKKQRRKK